MPAPGHRLQVAFGLFAAVGLAAAVGCDRSKEPPPKAAPAARVEAATPAKPLEAPPRHSDTAPLPPALATAVLPGTAKLKLEELQQGISRDALLATVGECVERVKVMRATPLRQSLEVFQPKDDPCKKQLGERHYVVVGGKLHTIAAGLRPKLDPNAPPPPEPSAPTEVPDAPSAPAPEAEEPPQ